MSAKSEEGEMSAAATHGFAGLVERATAKHIDRIAPFPAPNRA